MLSIIVTRSYRVRSCKIRLTARHLKGKKNNRKVSRNERFSRGSNSGNETKRRRQKVVEMNRQTSIIFSLKELRRLRQMTAEIERKKLCALITTTKTNAKISCWPVFNCIRDFDAQKILSQHIKERQSKDWRQQPIKHDIAIMQININ